MNRTIPELWAHLKSLSPEAAHITIGELDWETLGKLFSYLEENNLTSWENSSIISSQ